jgi:uncharacterized OB-fold protein
MDDDTSHGFPADAPPKSPDDVTADSPYTLPGFFDALADGVLLGVRCTSCGKRLIPPRPACYACGSRDVEIEPQPETGTVVSYTEVARPPSEFADLAPFTVAIVELETGARLTGRLEASYEETEIGMDVRVTVRGPEELPETSLSHEADWPLHVFELV